MEDFRKNVISKDHLMDLGSIPKKNGRILSVEENYKNHQEIYIALNEMTHNKQKNLKKTKLIRKLFKLPSQPDISDPSKFFERIDELKKPLSIRAKRMTLTDFFNAYEERTKDYYGNFANI